MSGIVKLVETENRMVVPGAGRREKLLFNGYRVSVLQDEKRLEADGDDGCIIMSVYLISLNCALKMVMMINFMLGVISPQFF